MSRSLIFAAVTAGALAIAPLAQAQDPKVCPEQENLVEAGSFTAKMESAGLIVGARWGSGEVMLKDGGKRAFSIAGGKLLEVGYSEAELEGKVYNLKNADAFEGTYVGLGGGATFGKGFGDFNLTNGACTVISMKVKTSSGLQLSTPMLNGIKFTYKN